MTMNMKTLGVKVLDDRNDVIKNSDIIVQLELPNDDVLLNI